MKVLFVSLFFCFAGSAFADINTCSMVPLLGIDPPVCNKIGDICRANMGCGAPCSGKVNCECVAAPNSGKPFAKLTMECGIIASDETME